MSLDSTVTPVPPAHYPPKRQRSFRIDGNDLKEGPTLSRRISEGAALGVDVGDVYDIEHAAVADDPRIWSFKKKHGVLLLISLSSLCSALTANIFFPAIDNLQRDLRISNSLLNAIVAVYILVQGMGPILWSAVSELRGRKSVYLASFTLYCCGTTAASRSQNGGVFFAMRLLQATGSSAVLAIGAGTLADIFDASERGTKLGIYYISPLLGPSLGSLLGGLLTLAGSWRTTFYLLIGYGVLCLIAFIFMPDTFRPERSKAYAIAVKRAEKEAARKSPGLDQPTRVKISLKDANPLLAVGAVMRQPINAMAIAFSGILFAIQYSLAFTGARTFAAAPYLYNPLEVGAILLVLGVGSMFGSVAGGRYSDKVYNRMKTQNNGVAVPIMRILSTRLAMLILLPSLVAYGWLVQYTTPIYWIAIALFVIGLSSIWIYSSTLAFIVDANPGRSTSAVACNSAMRGICGCAASFFAPAIVNSIGNGPLYSIWAGISLFFMAVLLLGARRQPRP